MRGEAYERYIAALYEEDGWDASTTRRTNDKGIDVVAEKDGRRVAVQCKHYSQGNAVGSPAVRELAGVLRRPDIHQGVVVTNSHFSRPAEQTARELGVELQQISYQPSTDAENSTNGSTKSESSSSESVNNYPLDNQFEKFLVKVGKYLVISEFVLILILSAGIDYFTLFGRIVTFLFGTIFFSLVGIAVYLTD